MKIKYWAVINENGYIEEIFSSKNEAIKFNGGSMEYTDPARYDSFADGFELDSNVVGGIENILMKTHKSYTANDIKEMYNAKYND